MPTTLIFNNFKSPQHFRNRFRRSEFQVVDANLHHGDVRPFACPEEVCTGQGLLRTLYPLPDCECLGFGDIRDIVRGFCGEQHFQIIGGTLRQSTEAQLCSGTTPNRAGAPYTPNHPNVGSGCSGCDATGVAYVVTFITEHAGIRVESAPSPASTIVASAGERPNATVTWAGAPAGFDIVATRLYRVETQFEDGTDAIPPQGAEFVFVREFGGGGGGTFFDNVPTHQTGGPLTTYEPMAFPAPPNLVGLARTIDGLVVADDHRIYISRPGQPQFTFDGVVEIEDQILAVYAVNNIIFVFTDNKPVKLSYVHTDGVMSIDKQVVERRLPLTSIRSVSIHNGVLYFASVYGLYIWNIGGYGSDIQLITDDVMTPEQYKQLDASSIRGVAYEFGYIFTGDGIDYSLMFERGQDGTDTLNQTSLMPITYINPDAFALDYDGHIMYQQGGTVSRWDYRRDVCNTGSFMIHDHVIPALCDRCEVCPWKISIYHDNEGKNRFTKMRIEWDERSATSLTANFYHKAFGEQSTIGGPYEVINSRGFSIPKFRSSQTFCVEVEGSGILHEIRLATSNQELVSNSNNQIENRAEE